MYLPCCFVVYGCSDVIKGGIFFCIRREGGGVYQFCTVGIGCRGRRRVGLVWSYGVFSLVAMY